MPSYLAQSCASSLTRDGTRSREYRGWSVRASLPRSRNPCEAFSTLHPPVAPTRSTVDYASGGCLAIVTLALLIACPTKVYHYHCHPSWPAQRTESARFAARTIQYSSPSGAFSLFLLATYYFSPFPPPSLSFSLGFALALALSVHFHPSPSSPGHSYLVCFRTRYYRAWKLSPALFELFATVLIRFVAAELSSPRQPAVWI